MLYVIQAGEGGPCKIGISRNPRGRMSKMQSDHHEPLRIIGLFEGDRAEEATIHSRFANERLSGEWFNPHPEILAGSFGLPRTPYAVSSRKRGPEPKNIKSPIGQIIEKAGGAAKLAARLNVARTTVLDWKRLGSIPGNRVLQISAELQMPADELLSLVQPPKPKVEAAA
jgi:hypothetical protein